MANYKTISIAFVVLAILFAATTAYLVAYPSNTTKTTTVIQTGTTTVIQTGAVTSTGYTINIAYKQGIGFYLTNVVGYTLYYRSTDTPNSGKTTCTTSTCEANWPAFYVQSLVLPPGLNASSFGTITAYNSTMIVTFDGYPLFYWIHDTSAGETSGQGVGDFYAATVPTLGGATTTTTTSSTSSTATTSTSNTSTSAYHGGY